MKSYEYKLGESIARNESVALLGDKSVVPVLERLRDNCGEEIKTEVVYVNSKKQLKKIYERVLYGQVLAVLDGEAAECKVDFHYWGYTKGTTITALGRAVMPCLDRRSILCPSLPRV